MQWMRLKGLHCALLPPLSGLKLAQQNRGKKWSCKHSSGVNGTAEQVTTLSLKCDDRLEQQSWKLLSALCMTAGSQQSFIKTRSTTAEGCCVWEKAQKKGQESADTLLADSRWRFTQSQIKAFWGEFCAQPYPKAVLLSWWKQHFVLQEGLDYLFYQNDAWPGDKILVSHTSWTSEPYLSDLQTYSNQYYAQTISQQCCHLLLWHFNLISGQACSAEVLESGPKISKGVWTETGQG